MTRDEQINAICEQFTKGDLQYLDAIEELQKLGVNPKDAERLIDELTDYEYDLEEYEE